MAELVNFGSSMRIVKSKIVAYFIPEKNLKTVTTWMDGGFTANYNFLSEEQAESELKKLDDIMTDDVEQQKWKPSKEQLNGLKEAIEFLGCTKTRREHLQSLYEQLKKL